MDILDRLNIVIETTLDGHPELTIMHDYKEAAKEITRLRNELSERQWRTIESAPRDG